LAWFVEEEEAKAEVEASPWPSCQPVWAMECDKPIHCASNNATTNNKVKANGGALTDE